MIAGKNENSMKRENSEMILGYPITTKTQRELINEIVSIIDMDQKMKYAVFANPHSLEVAMKDPVFEAAIKNADFVTPDGVGLVIASRIFGGAVHNRITGSDIFRELSGVLNEKGGYSYYFLGSTERNLEMIREKMAVDFPNIRVAGAYSPPYKPEFSDDDNRLMAEAINRAKPDVLWVGMTAPKQEKWIFLNKHRLNVKFVGAIGAVFDFYTGNVQRANPFFQRLGLEWLLRLLREPRRLWRRYLVSSPIFMLKVIGRRMYLL